MDIAVYRQLISELVTPQVIRLNYSGESAHYPHLIEAIELAKQKGARVELVSAFSSIKPKLIEPLVRSGLDLLCISIHTLEPEQYRDIYGFGSRESLLLRLQQLREAQAEVGISTPRLEFALVAMERNLDQIPAVMALAESLGVSRLDIHPVIRRDPIKETFPIELDDSNRLRKAFIDRLGKQVENARQSHPGIHVNFSTPEIEVSESVLGESATAWPAQLPKGAKILSCEQNPWNTIHVLANGDVVTCEVHDQKAIGHLTQSGLREIWHGTDYQDFRHQYVNGQIPKCNACAYKIACQPTPATENPIAPPNTTVKPDNKVLRLAKTSVAHAATLALSYSLAGAEIAGSVARRIWSGHQGRRPESLMTGNGSGISIIIPERDSPELLKRCLLALYQAIAQYSGDCEIVVIVNGTSPETYEELKKEFPALKWHFEQSWLGFADAIQRGLTMAQYDWVFLLNTDMQLEPTALQAVYQHRARHIFALACQIFMADKTKRREETGFTGLNTAEGLQGLYDGLPYIEGLASTHIYAGGGASLFQRDLLSQLVQPPGSYKPFYWEDFDWGFRAQQLGYQVLFIPQARAHHQHRATVSRFFPEQEIREMFECNALLTGLSFGWYQPSFKEMSIKLAQYRRGIFRPSRLSAMIKKRFVTGKASTRPRLSEDEVVCFYPRTPIPGDMRPWLVMVSPYLVYPLAHGGAVRIDGISRVLARHYRLVLVCDEGWGFDPKNAERLNQFEAVHLLRSPRETTAPNRLARMKGHARPLLCQEVARALLIYQPSIVQIEYEELCDLVKLKHHERWFMTLHDVNRGDRNADNYLDRRLRRFDGIFCCSVEDQGLLPGKSQLVENGTSMSQFSARNPSRGQTLLFTGPFRYKPNRIGMEWFIREVFSVLARQFPRLKLKILCGDEGLKYADQSPFKHPQIKLLPHSNKVSEHLQAATMTINPLRDIAGSCLKTIESLAANRMCVSTQDAARGLKHHHLPGLLTIESSEQFVKTISSLLTDEPLRHRLEKSPPELIQDFDWSRRTENQVAAYEA